MSPLTSYLLQTAVTLAAIIAVAFLIVHGARRTGAVPPGGPLEMIARLPLEGRRAIYLVRVGERVYVVGASEGGLEKLGELPREEVPDGGTTLEGGFAEVLGRALRRTPGSTRRTKGTPHA